MAQSFSAPFFFYNTLRLGVISMSYFTAAQIGDEPHPPMEDLKINYKSGRIASENGALGYIGRRKE